MGGQGERDDRIGVLENPPPPAEGVQVGGRGTAVAVQGATVGAGGVERDQDGTATEECWGQYEAEDQ